MEVIVGNYNSKVDLVIMGATQLYMAEATSWPMVAQLWHGFHLVLLCMPQVLLSISPA